MIGGATLVEVLPGRLHGIKVYSDAAGPVDGVAGVGVVIRASNPSRTLWEGCAPRTSVAGLGAVGRSVNVAELAGLLWAIELAGALCPGAGIVFRTDSQALTTKLAKRGAARNAWLGCVLAALKRAKIKAASVQWVGRIDNKRADYLATKGLRDEVVALPGLL